MSDSPDCWRSSATGPAGRSDNRRSLAEQRSSRWGNSKWKMPTVSWSIQPWRRTRRSPEDRRNTDYSNFAHSVDGRAKVCDAGKSSPQVGVLDRKARVGQMTSIAMRMKVGTAAGAIALAASFPAVASVSAAPAPDADGSDSGPG